MAGKSESISAYDGAGDVLTPYTNVPSCSVGEFSARGVNPMVADLNQNGSTETRRTNDGVAAK